MILKLLGFLFLTFACIDAKWLRDSESTTTENPADATTTTARSIESIFRELRKNKTTKDADLIIKMSGDFIVDMQQKMNVIKRVERTYENSAEFLTGTVYDDIQRRFKHMCDLYKEFATVTRYVLGRDLNDTAPQVHVVSVYQLMLSDFNEILMMLELFKIEQLSWADGSGSEKVQELIKKQMEKFGHLPADLTPPRIQEQAVGDVKITTAKGKRRWAPGGAVDYPQKWSGELDGVGFDNR